jgi:anti-anti-sigma regulatory factor
MSVWKANPAGLDILSDSRARRIQAFIIILAILDLPLLVVGLLDLRSSPVTLLLVLSSYAYYALYYALLRAGYGVPATYVCVALLAFLMALGIHNGGGSLSVSSALYFLLLVGVALVLDDPVAVDVTVVICLLAYSGLAFYEAYIESPAAPAFERLYQNSSALATGSTIAGMLIALIGCWLLMRITVAGLRRSTAALERSRAEAEARATENATLAAQVQAGNESLLATQALLRNTIDALSLPLIPLDHGVALLPLVGYLDDVRSGQLVETLLDGIHKQQARTVIIDLTGLRDIDASAATALLDAARAAELLGAQVLLSGIGANAAETLVDVGVDLRGLRTVASLGQALRLIAEQRDGTHDLPPTIS